MVTLAPFRALRPGPEAAERAVSVPYDVVKHNEAVRLADGHHRALSALHGQEERREANAKHDGSETYNYFLAAAFPASEVRTVPYNRYVHDLHGLKEEEFVARLGAVCRLDMADESPVPRRRGRVSVWPGGRWFGLDLPPGPTDDPVASLDVAILQRVVLDPILGISDPAKSQRITFVGGSEGAEMLQEMVEGRPGSVAFSLYPVSVEDVMRVADAGRLLPPKATWFEPKLRSGLFVHLILGADSMNVLIADKFPERCQRDLAAVGCGVAYDPTLKDSHLMDALREKQPEVLIVRSTRVTEEMLEASPNLSLVVRAGAGTNTIAVAEAAERGIYVANCPGKNSIAVAELALGLILACDRQIPNGTADLRAGKWNKKKYGQAKGLFGRTLGLIGLGRIGREMIPRAKAFGMKVIAWSRSLTEEEAEALEIEALPNPIAVASRSDVLSVHIALTPETEGMIGRHIFDALPERAIFVNTSRGGVVDEAALLKAVREKGIRVGLDVYREEPASAVAEFESPLREVALVFGTHHIGASTEQAQDALAEEVVRIVSAYRTKGVVHNAVNLCERSPATYLLDVRHVNRVGVLAGVFDALKKANINVQETDNIIFDGASAAVARIRLDRKPADATIEAIRASRDVLAATLIQL